MRLTAVLAAILLHEAGHLAAAKLCGIPLRAWEIRPTGLSLTFDFSRAGYLREALVHVGGPAAGLIAASLSSVFGERAYFFSGLNAVLALVNLLPADGFDGGGILRCLLSCFLLPDTVWRIGRIVSAAGIGLLWAASVRIALRTSANPAVMLFPIGVMLAAAFPANENGGG